MSNVPDEPFVYLIITSTTTTTTRRLNPNVKPFVPRPATVITRKVVNTSPQLPLITQRSQSLPPRSRSRSRSRNRALQNVTTPTFQTVQRPLPAAQTTVTTNTAFKTVINRSEMCHQVVLETDLTKMFDYPINPGCDQLFPWLSKLASSFDMYEFNALKFRYVPSCGSTTQGQITMAIDYDPTDTNVGLTQSDLASMGGSAQSQLYTPFVMAMKKEAIPVAQHKFYVSSESVYDQSARLNHVGRLLYYIAADPTVKTTYGTLYVDYSVVMYNPQTSGPGFSNNGTVKNTTKGSTGTDVFGTVDQASLVTTKPDETATPNKTRRIVKIIDGIMNVIAKVAPYVSIVAKLFLLDYCPPFPGTYLNHAGVATPLAIADIPGDTVLVVNSAKCRSGSVFVHVYGTYTTLVNASRPVITLAHSTNVDIKVVIQVPTYLDTDRYLPATPVLATATALFEFDFNEHTSESAWMKPVVSQSGTDVLPAWSVDTTICNVFTKADI